MSQGLENKKSSGVAEETLQHAIDSIPEDFRLICDPIPLRTPSGGWDVMTPYEAIRNYLSKYSANDLHVSTVALERGDADNVFIRSIGGHIAIYLRDGAVPNSSRLPQNLGQTALSNQLDIV